MSQPVDGAANAGPPAVASAWAWGLCWLMFGATVLNYMDRQTVSLLKEPICAAFRIEDNAGFGQVLAAFYLTYALFQVPAGFLVDRWGLRGGYALAVAWWSLATLATAIVPSLGLLLVCRALLGVGESFNWPCALRATARILPPGDRSFGNGIFNSGAAVGAVAAPLAVTYLTERYNWRAPFGLMGALGFVWVAAWLFLVRGEQRRLLAAPAPVVPQKTNDQRAALPRGVGAALAFVLALALGVGLSARSFGRGAIWAAIALAIFGPLVVAALTPPRALDGPNWLAALRTVARSQRFWILVLVSITINVCWHSLLSWVPTYLKDERKLDFKSGNLLSIVPYLAADFGNLFGGWIALRLARRRLGALNARRMVMTVATVLIVAAGLSIGAARQVSTAVLLVSIMAAATTAFMANYFSFTQEVSARHTGLVVGYLGAIGNLCVAGSLPIAGGLKDLTGSFAPVFVIVSVAPIVGLAALLTCWGGPLGADCAEDAPDGSA